MTTPTIPPIVVMGVSGSGKTTIGTMLAAELGVPFIDADDLHPRANKEKMRAGIPLDDEDRWPWLKAVGEAIARAESAVTACSALKRSYRDRLREFAPDAVLVHLVGDKELLAQRIGNRDHEFMAGSLLESQFQTLEPLEADEPGVVVDVAPGKGEIVREAIERLRAKGLM